IEIIFMDDGSDPPLKTLRTYGLKNFAIYPTGDTRPWSQACARNLGAKIAQGEFLLMTDIDHILSKDAIMAVRNFTGDKMTFSRFYAILDRHGKISQNLRTLYRYGFTKKRYKKHRLRKNRHTNTFAIRRSIYFEIGGYHPRHCNRPLKGNKGDRNFFNRYLNHHKQGHCEWHEVGPHIYTYPGLPEDPLNIFHKLKRGI
ncbi:MAG: glycosyltransferase family A protein, partial [Planctomycetota bacterium]